MGSPEGAKLGPRDGHRSGARSGDPSCHRLGPRRKVHGAFGEPGVQVLVDLDNGENGLEELDFLDFGPELPFGWDLGQAGVPQLDSA